MPEHFKTLIIKQRRKSQLLWWANVLENQLNLNIGKEHEKRMKFNGKTAQQKNQDCLQGRLDCEEIFQEFNERNVGYEIAGGTARRGQSLSFIEQSE